MKTMRIFTTLVVLAITSIFTSCEQLKSLADVDINTNYIVDIPVKLVSADAQSTSFSMSLADVDELDEYFDLLKDLTISDIELSVLSYQGDIYTGDLELTADGATLWHKDDVIASNIEPFKLKSDANLDKDVLAKLAKKLLNKESVKGGLNVESDNSDPITASFTVRCKFILDITANVLK